VEAIAVKAPQKTQRQIVLEMLEERGDRGLHSFEFIQARIPRVAARVCELRAEGYSIESEREALHGAADGVRYRLNVGSSTEGRDQAGTSIPQPVDATSGVASGVEASSSLLAPASEASARALNPYEAEVWEDAA
jgi:hypothetical protein